MTPIPMITPEEMFRQVTEYVKQALQTRNIDAIANELGVSRTQAHEIKNGNLVRKSTGKREFSDAKIREIYPKIKKGAPADTQQFMAINNVVAYLKQNSAVMCLVGKTGYGKTTTYQHVMNKYSNVYYVLCDISDDAESVLIRIHSALGLKTPALKGKKLRRQIVENIASFAGKQEDIPVLILDDSHHPAKKVSVFQELKLLFDLTKGVMSFLLSGTDLLEEALLKYAGFKRDKHGEIHEAYKARPLMAEFHSRLRGNYRRIPNITEEDLITMGVYLRMEKAEARRVAKLFIHREDLEYRLFEEKIKIAQKTMQASESITLSEAVRMTINF